MFQIYYCLLSYVSDKEALAKCCRTYIFYFICLFEVLHLFQHCTVHITMDSWKGRGNQYILLVKVLYCKLPTSIKELPVFPLEAVPETEPQPQRWEARVLPLCHHGPYIFCITSNTKCEVPTFSNWPYGAYIFVI